VSAAESLPTSLSIRDMRSDALHRLLLSPRGRVATVDEIPGLVDLASWTALALDVAIADLVAVGLLAEGPRGELIVHGKPA
jgi:hypothetical protein